jgi:hypothetical protein
LPLRCYAIDIFISFRCHAAFFIDYSSIVTLRRFTPLIISLMPMLTPPMPYAALMLPVAIIQRH